MLNLEQSAMASMIPPQNCVHMCLDVRILVFRLVSGSISCLAIDALGVPLQFILIVRTNITSAQLQPGRNHANWFHAAAIKCLGDTTVPFVQKAKYKICKIVRSGFKSK
jgi:hypothetical protein